MLFSVALTFAQNGINSEIAEAEMKAASSLANLEVNPNTLNYDVTFHRLQFTVDPDEYFISGIVTTTYTALTNMSTLTFDLTNELNVSSVTRNGLPLSFVQNANDELVINLGTAQPAGTSATVVITYSGQPSSDEQAFTTTTHVAQPVLYTLSEPFGARDWWPCKQDLNDKIDNIEIWITAPSQYVAVSNGLQQSATVNGANKTTIWHHNYPIPAYLVAIAVTNYTIFTQQAGTAPYEFPIINYYYPENSSAPAQLAQTLPIMDLYETLFEKYPFWEEKYGHAQFSWGGGMEHTTISFMQNFSRDLIAHELGHQWFGDKVTCGSWNDIWLNEGFATYLSGLTIEHLDGPADFIDWKGGLVNHITSSPGGSVYVPELEADNVNRIFSSRLSYNKGAMVIEMLRWKLGDATFFQGVRNYLADPDLAYDFAVTADLQSHLEAVSGQDLDGFFADWIYGQGYPSYSITAHNAGFGQVQFLVAQEQSHPSVSFFEMPLPIRLYGANGQVLDIVLQNTADNQTITAAVPFPVVSFEFDPDIHLISNNNSTTLGSQDFTLEAIALYPNPAAAVLNISLPSSASFDKADIYNAIGQLVLSSYNAEINVETLSSGVHFVKIQTSEGTFTKKFIKK
jgi:aminopeptidase N